PNSPLSPLPAAPPLPKACLRFHHLTIQELWKDFLRESSLGSSDSVGSSRTSSSSKSELDEVLTNLQADPGLRIRMIEYDTNIRDEVRRAYLQKGPCQPRVDSEAFTGAGFKNWKKGRERMKVHVGPVGSVHNKAREAATNLMNQNTHIETAVSKHSEQARMAYRRCLIASIKCTKFLLRQDNDEKVKEVVLENAPGNLKLVAPKIQKDIVNACAGETLDVIMSGLKDRFFSILVDEARDISVKGQMAMVLRYVDDKGHAILGLTNDMSQALQKKDQEIVNAMALVKSCKEKLHWMRNNGFDALVEEVSSFCDKHHIDVPNMDEAFVLPERSRRNAPIKTNRHHYRVELFIYVIDEQLTELDDRFNEL
ncbi:General transcription factor 2-related zinc finger protein, partial [Prunus dulcis]